MDRLLREMIGVIPTQYRVRWLIFRHCEHTKSLLLEHTNSYLTLSPTPTFRTAHISLTCLYISFHISMLPIISGANPIFACQTRMFALNRGIMQCPLTKTESSSPSRVSFCEVYWNINEIHALSLERHIAILGQISSRIILFLSDDKCSLRWNNITFTVRLQIYIDRQPD